MASHGPKKSADSSANDALAQITNTFREEHPKLDTAIKNYMAYLTALKVSTGGDDTPAVTPKHILMLSRYVLNGLNDPSLLPSIADFGQKYEQRSDQDALERIDEIARYKVAFTLGKKLQEQGAKRTRFFGKSYLAATKIWTDLENYVQRRVAVDEAKLWSDPIVKEFPAAYMKGLNDSLSDDPDDSLIWCTNLSEVMKKRQAKRQDRANQNIAAKARAEAELKARMTELVASAADDGSE